MRTNKIDCRYRSAYNLKPVHEMAQSHDVRPAHVDDVGAKLLVKVSSVFLAAPPPEALAVVRGRAAVDVVDPGAGFVSVA